MEDSAALRPAGHPVRGGPDAENGYEVSCSTPCLCRNPHEVIKEIKDNQPAFFVMYDDGFNYLTKMCLTNMREAAFTMNAWQTKGVYCNSISSDSTDHYAQYIERGADFIIIGEAEQTLLQLTTAIASNDKNYTTIEGLAYMNDGQLIKNSQAQCDERS